MFFHHRCIHLYCRSDWSLSVQINEHVELQLCTRKLLMHFAHTDSPEVDIKKLIDIYMALRMRNCLCVECVELSCVQLKQNELLVL